MRAIEDSVLDNEIFTDRDEKALSRGLEKELNKIGIEYPDWVTFDDDTKEKLVISWDGSHYVIAGDTRKWETLATVVDEFSYLSLLSDHGGKHQDAHYTLDESIMDSPEVKSMNGAFVELHDGQAQPQSSITERDLAVYSYYCFLHSAKSWLENPDSLFHAFNFLDYHPAFWHRSRPEQYPNQWSTNELNGNIWQHVSRDEKGNTVVMLEHGRAFPNAYHHHSHDPALDIYAPSFDEAYIQLAKKVHAKFAINGVERQIVIA